MMRITMTLALAALTGGCARFDSVKATAAIGARLGDYQGTLDYLPARCRRLAGVSGLGECAKIADDEGKWRKPVAVLVRYAKALDALAAEQDPEVSDRIATLVGAAGSLAGADVNDVMKEGVSGMVDQIVDAITGAYRGRKLREVVAGVNAVVAQLASRLTQEVEAQRSIVTSLQGDLDVSTQLLVDVGGGVKPSIDKELRTVEGLQKQNLRATLVTVADLRVGLDDEARALERLRRTLQSFATAHGLLATKWCKGSDDGATLDEIMKATRAAFDDKEPEKGSR
jgi:hypothetical protein